MDIETKDTIGGAFMEEAQSKKRIRAMNFADLGISVGTVLTYRKSEKTCTVVDTKNKVEYEGQVYTLSGLAKKLVGTQASGFATFYKDGVRLSALAHKTPTAAEIAPTAASGAAIPITSPQDAPQAHTATIAQNAASEADSDAAEKASESVEASSIGATVATEGESTSSKAFDIF